MAPSAADEDALVAGQWTRLAGGAGDRAWDPMCFKRARGLASFRDHLYVGLESQRKGNAEVWRRDGRGDWVAVGGDGRNASWVTADEVVRLVPYGDRLLAGVAGSNLEAEVWSWDGEAWRRVGSAEQGSWPNNRFQVAQSMAVMGGALYVGMWCREDTTEKHPCLYRYDGDGWTQVGDPPWDSTGPEEGVYELAVHGDALYAGLGGEAGAGGWAGHFEAYAKSRYTHHDRHSGPRAPCHDVARSGGHAGRPGRQAVSDLPR